MEKRKNITNKILLHCTDKKFETHYTTAEMEGQNLVVRDTKFPHRVNRPVDYICKFNIKSTQRFIELISEEQFLEALKKKFHSSESFEKIKEFADSNNLKYKIYDHFDYDEYNIFRYNFGDIYEDCERLYYENGKIIIPTMYNPPENGVCKIYTSKGNLLYEITYKNNLKNGLMRNFVQDSETVQLEQYYKDDVLDGIATSYYEDGTLKSKELFKDGNFIKVIEKNINHVDAWYCA